MPTWSQADRWDAIVRLSQVSTSLTSETQRQLASNFDRLSAVGIANFEQPQTVDIKPTIEADTGKLASYKA